MLIEVSFFFFGFEQTQLICIHVIFYNIFFIFQIFDDICDFKFIPLNKSEKDPVTEQDGITKRTFSVDTSYLIIRYESNESIRVKRSRLDNMIKRIQSKPEKKPVDLR